MTRNEKIGVGTGTAALLALIAWLLKKKKDEKEGGGGGGGQVALSAPPAYGTPPGVYAPPGGYGIPGGYVSPPLAPLPADPVRPTPTAPAPPATMAPPLTATSTPGIMQASPGMRSAPPPINILAAPPALLANRPVIKGADPTPGKRSIAELVDLGLDVVTLHRAPHQAGSTVPSALPTERPSWMVPAGVAVAAVAAVGTTMWVKRKAGPNPAPRFPARCTVVITPYGGAEQRLHFSGPDRKLRAEACAAHRRALGDDVLVY